MFKMRFFEWIRRSLSSGTPLSPPLPDQPLAIIGDIHGRADLLEDLLQRIPEGFQIVCVGDYVDRGEQSSEVIRMLVERTDVICLKGNHEDMLLKFLEDPERHGDRWLRYGGLQTLHSFGVLINHTQDPELRFRAARNDLEKSLGKTGLKWLERLELSWCSGNVHVVHAGADPSVPMKDQERSVLFWGHPEFLRKPHADGIWIVHGHTIVDEARNEYGRIPVDTGAYATGRLTAALISEGQVEFLRT